MIGDRLNICDEENRLILSLARNGSRMTHTYAGNGLRRTLLDTDGTLTTMIWDGTDYLMELR